MSGDNNEIRALAHTSSDSGDSASRAVNAVLHFLHTFFCNYCSVLSAFFHGRCRQVESAHVIEADMESISVPEKSV